MRARRTRRALGPWFYPQGYEALADQSEGYADRVQTNINDLQSYPEGSTG